MLCNSNSNNKRPDKALQSRLVALMYFLSLLFISIITLVIIPIYFVQIFLFIIICISTLFFLGLSVIKVAEEAISFGGFANALIKNDNFIKRIETTNNQTVIQNAKANELFGSSSVAEFIINNHKDCSVQVQKLLKALENLSQEEVELCLDIKGIAEHFVVSIKPIYLRKEDLLDAPFSIKKIYKKSYALWSFENITSKKSVDKIFISEQKYLQDFIDYLPVGVYTIDKDYNIEYANNAFASMLETTKDNIIDKNLKEYLSYDSNIPQSINYWSDKVSFNIANKGLFEASIFQNGFKVGDKIKNHGVVVTGISSQKDIIKELNIHKNLQNMLFDNSPIGIAFITKAGDIKKINKSAIEFLENKDINICKDLNISLENAQTNISINNKDLSCYIQKSYEDNNYILFMIDTSKQKSLELQFAQAQKMQALGQMASGVSHDFNNLLTAMIGFCDLLIARHGVGDPSFADLIQIKQNATRAAGLVQQLLAFSRKQALKTQLIDVLDSITDISQMLKRVLGGGINLEIFHEQNLGSIKVDSTQFSQVIINLAINAKDAMNNKGTLKIKTYNYELKEPYQFGQDLIMPNNFVCIEVEDTGCGIEPKNINKIFDPFFSTKENVVGSGTGLGLAMVYGIIRQTQGFIKVKSIVGSGTQFFVYLPLCTEDKEEYINYQTTVDGKPVMEIKEEIKAPISVSQKMILGLNVSTIDRKIQESKLDTKKARILFVEDEHSVRTFGVRAFSKKGFDVVQAASGEEALDILKTDKNFQILFSDVAMPGISGVELAKLIKADIKDIKIILTSGYTQDLLDENDVSLLNAKFLAKPYSLGDLTSMIVSVL